MRKPSASVLLASCRPRSLVILLLASSLTCVGITDPCYGSITVTVSPSTEGPMFDWLPRCAVTLLTVRRDTPDAREQELLWSIGAEDEWFIPPLRYGQSGNGTVNFGPVSLIQGVTYR